MERNNTFPRITASGTPPEICPTLCLSSIHTSQLASCVPAGFGKGVSAGVRGVIGSRGAPGLSLRQTPDTAKYPGVASPCSLCSRRGAELLGSLNGARGSDQKATAGPFCRTDLFPFRLIITLAGLYPRHGPGPDPGPGMAQAPPSLRPLSANGGAPFGILSSVVMMSEPRPLWSPYSLHLACPRPGSFHCRCLNQ